MLRSLVGLLTAVYAILTGSLAHAHSPYERELARVERPDASAITVYSVWGDGLIGPDPVIGAVVLRSYAERRSLSGGVIVALTPGMPRGEFFADCPRIERCFVHHLDRSARPSSTWRLSPNALSQPLARFDAEWGGCNYTGLLTCPEHRGFERAPSPVIAASLSPMELVGLGFVFGPLAGIVWWLTSGLIASNSSVGRRWARLIVAIAAAIPAGIWLLLGLFYSDAIAIELGALLIAVAALFPVMNKYVVPRLSTALRGS